MFIFRIATVCILVLMFTMPVLADVDWADPATIDPLQENIGDFLDVDLTPFREKAREAYNAGEWEEAAKYYLALVRYDINDGGNIYNLACCYGLLGEAELAAKFIERAVAAGFDNINHIMWDPDFESVRGQQIFDDAVDGLSAKVQEQEGELGDLDYFDAPAFFPCRIKLPDNYDPQNSYPLIVGLHGYGSSPDRFITLWDKFAEHEFIYVSPQAPYPFQVGKNIGYSWMQGIPDQKYKSDKAHVMSEKYITRVVKNLRQQYNVGDVYLLGFSQGCAHTYMVGIKHHELFKGLICFGGWLDIDWLSEENINEANDLRIFIAHGTEDRMVEFEAGIKARDYLIDHGYDVVFHEFDGAHSVPEEALQAAEVWMRE